MSSDLPEPLTTLPAPGTRTPHLDAALYAIGAEQARTGDPDNPARVDPAGAVWDALNSELIARLFPS